MEKSVAYDLKKDPGKYLDAMLKMCQAMERRKIHFLPTRTTNVMPNSRLNSDISPLQGKDQSQEAYTDQRGLQ